MEPPSNPSIIILNESGRRLRIQPIRQAIQVALSRHGRDSAPVSVLLTNDEEIQELNRRFRAIDEPTDVLTFPSGEHGRSLGDIAISVAYAERQASARKVSLSQELAYLAIHGALHLVGFDDEAESDRLAMVAEMNEVAKAAGLKPDLEWHSLLHAAQEASA